MNSLRNAAQAALEALENAEDHLAKPYSTDASKAITALRAALAQQAEPVEPVAWGWVGDPSTQDYASTQPEPVASLNAWAEARLARHGIQVCLYPQCVGGQSGTVCHKHCPTPCTDCRGLGYDASGQLCACQQNPSF